MAFLGFVMTAFAASSWAADHPSNPSQPAAAPQSQSPATQAVDALQTMLRAFENGDATVVEAAIEPTLVGLTALLKSVDESHARQRAIRVHLQDIQATAGRDEVLVGANWEKRYMNVASAAPGLAKGHATFVFRQRDQRWKMVGMTGDNLFAAGL
jgi:hypothetical protein